MPRRSDTVLVDSGFFIALLDPRDPHHSSAIERQEWLEGLSVVVPWPVLYETINTRFARRPATIEGFERVLRRPETELLDDSRYRDGAFEKVFVQARRGYGALSLVDFVLCGILSDVNVPIDAMLTFNHRDFASLCGSRGVALL